MRKVFAIYVFLLWLSLSLAACDVNSIFEDSDGNEIALLRVDMPQYPASYLFTFIENGMPVPEEMTAVLDGTNAEDIVTDAGRTDYAYNIKSASLDLYLNPAIKLGGNRLVDFTVKGRWNGNKMILPMVVQHTLGGCKNIFVDVVTLPDSPPTIDEPLITVRDESGVELKPLMDLSGYQTGSGYRYLNLYKAPAAGNYSAEPRSFSNGEISGLYTLADDFMLTPSAKIHLAEGEVYFFTVFRPRSLKETSVTFRVRSADRRWAEFEYAIMNGGVTYRGVVSGVMPFEQIIEGVFLDPNAKSTQVKITPCDQVQVTQDQFTVADLSSNSTIVLNAAIKENPKLRKYDFTITARCPSERRVAYAVSKNFKYARGTKNSKETRTWHNGQLSMGKTVLNLEPNVSYTFRISINNHWYDYDFTTAPADVSNVVSDENKIWKYTLTPNSITIEIENEDFCLI